MKNYIYGRIYAFTNINSKQYVGQTIAENIEKYWEGHRRAAENGSNRCIHNAIRKYGWNNFKKEVVCTCGDKLSLGLMEDFCIVYFNSLAPNGYNLRRGGIHGKLSNIHKQNISKSLKGKLKSEEHKQAMSDKAKIRLSIPENNPMYGVHRYGENNPMFGKIQSKEARQKMRDAWKKREKMLIETKQKISTGIKTSEKYKKAQEKINSCPFCNQLFSKLKIKQHIKACSKNPNRIKLIYNLNSKKYRKAQEKINQCSCCNRMFSKIGIKQHIKSCSKNPNRIKRLYKKRIKK